MKLLKRPLHNSIGGPLWWTLSIVGLVLSGWGFVPHRHLHAKAWSYLPHDMRAAWPVHPTTLMELATRADTRKHTDSLEAERHYLDLDDLRAAGLHVWGTPWSEARTFIADEDSTQSPRRYGVLPWNLEWAYHKLVEAWSPSDSVPVDAFAVSKAASDLGHYIADAHVPLHTSGNYNGQRTNQKGVHALWETQAVEWMLSPTAGRHCPPCDLGELVYDPVWTPWEIITESHALVSEVLEAEEEWNVLCAHRGFGFQRRGRTMQLLPTEDALLMWDSLTHGHTWPRFCLAAHRIAAAWHAAWIDAGRPKIEREKAPNLWERLELYLPRRTTQPESTQSHP